MGRYMRVFVSLILALVLAKAVNMWTSSLFYAVFDFHTQVYLREMLKFEELPGVWLLVSWTLSFYMLKKALEVTGNIVAIYIVTVPSTVQSSLSDQGKEKDQPAALNSIEPPLRSSADLYLSLDLPDNIDLSEQIDKVFQTMSIASSSVLESADTADANTSVDPSHHESIMASSFSEDLRQNSTPKIRFGWNRYGPARKPLGSESTRRARRRKHFPEQEGDSQMSAAENR